MLTLILLLLLSARCIISILFLYSTQFFIAKNPVFFWEILSSKSIDRDSQLINIIFAYNWSCIYPKVSNAPITKNLKNH